jgi:hypothetical protein
VFFAALSAAYSQTSLQEGDSCLSKGDYACAKTKYTEAFNSASGKDKQMVEIKLNRANWCAEHIALANQAYNNKNYTSAKGNYQSVLDSNPDDSYAKSQLERCNNALTTLSVSKDSISFSSEGGKGEQISVQTNADTYSVNILPSWCTVQTDKGYFVITCSANSGTTARSGYVTVTAGDKTVRVNVSQAGKTPPPPATTLSVSIDSISFPSEGGKSEQISVQGNAGTYSVDILPSWCTVQTYNDYFVITCSANNSYRSRSGWFWVVVGNQAVEIIVNQAGVSQSQTTTSKSNTTTSRTNNSSCFNCPKGDISSWGLTFGYAEMNYEYANRQPGFQAGLRFEPLFKYGFGLNFGLNYESYNYDYGKYVDDDYYKFDVKKHILNFNAGLEYRLNFSKWFNVYVYGGTIFNYCFALSGSYDVKTYNADDPARFSKYVDWGVGLRINHLQFNVIESNLWDSFDETSNLSDFYSSPRKIVFSTSYMF